MMWGAVLEVAWWIADLAPVAALLIMAWAMRSAHCANCCPRKRRDESHETP